ncbi:Plant invertase/pectin methylesterase inhibitor superfamily [Euphorbia peplus]|nr:Plant invertase/pectin methylesterase inhibitor superfamily [Euphorbia peplus]
MRIMLKYLIILWVLGSSLEFIISSSIIDENLQITLEKECNFTRYPRLCFKTVMEDVNDQHVHIMSVLVNKTISETMLPSSFFNFHSSLSSELHIQQAQSLSEYCSELMEMSLKRLDQSLSALKQSPKHNKNDIQTWLSAALTYQQACKDSADTFRGHLSDDRLSRKMAYLSKLASNPLALVNRITGSKSKKRHLAEEKQEFPSWVSAKDRKLLQTTTVKANAVVAQDGTGNYETVSEAIKAASGNRFVIYVKAGVYNEKIKSNKDGITLIGDGKYNTIIVNDDSVAGGSSMPGSATFTITGDGFIARDIGFQNTAGPDGEQALALYVASDHSVIYRCSIVGYQDTLYALALRQFYRECDIYGTIDFIFGNSAAVFQNCYLVLRRPLSGSYNVILAHGRTDPGQNTGFSVQNCRITPSSEFSPVKHKFKSYLGRPWKPYSRSVVMESAIDDAISKTGWIEWPGEGSYGKTLYFAEYSNTGPGAGVSERVQWHGYRVIGPEDAVQFTVGNFIAGTSWIPSTGVTFISGLQ